jgi:transcriptional regulator with XRE-family HTH domain
MRNPGSASDRRFPCRIRSDTLSVMGAHLLERVRHEAGLSQEELAARAGTSRTTISAYEHGRKSPTLATASRLLATAGFELTAEPTVTFAEVSLRHGRPAFVADRLWRLPLREAFAEVTLPLGLNWSIPGAVFDLADRRRRSRCYEIVLREGAPADLLRFVDGALLVDAWADLVLPRELRTAWQPVIDAVLP